MPRSTIIEGVECVTWRQHKIGLASVFVGNALFSIILLAMTGQRGAATTNTNAVYLDSDRERTALIEQLAMEQIHARLQSTASSVRPGSSNDGSPSR